ncbi:uncharacterized protein LOC108653163 [Drosophila navojoa]|uniref:uncharacterized protein LOC108653163 n=1 Tax=Drosophila navojoa TaxID=7232 RepID=UPI0008466FDE|nr:uncharacterized protein LOC108653163 [Drosophila navojoa]
MDAIDKTEVKQSISETSGATELGDKAEEKPESPTTSQTEIKEQPVVYDYMKYPNKKKGRVLHNHHHNRLKMRKNVSFKCIVELVTYTDDWKMQTTQSKLRTEDQQRERSKNLRRNF